MKTIKTFGDLKPGDSLYVYHVDACDIRSDAFPYPVKETIIVDKIEPDCYGTKYMYFKKEIFQSINLNINKDEYIYSEYEKSRMMYEYVYSTLDNLDELIKFAYQIGERDIKIKFKQLFKL